ncbi:saxitoxin and tetrodotoxin-binding protein 1-like [Clinocottus analis]|uniref:saxitoxin and tetrodotoxin-binding protein 1-like n=1 Tax=Clinocottus analis TaxID=304258 RepID=UPI0035C13F9D
MNLWLSTLFLAAGLFLSSSTPTPEECQPLITPLSLADPSIMFGRSNFLYGYTDSEFYSGYLKNIKSYWIDINRSPSNPETIVMTMDNKQNGSCISLKTNLNFEGNTIKTSFSNFTATFHMYPTCEDCLLYSFNRTVKNLDKMYKKMEFNIESTAEEFSYRAFYLMGRGSTVKDSDLEHFRKQASCLGFDREPDFIYDPKNEFCAEGEGRKIPEYFE